MDSICCAQQVQQIDKVIQHHEYKGNRNNYDHDIALIKTKQPFWLNNVSTSTVETYKSCHKKSFKKP